MASRTFSATDFVIQRSNSRGSTNTCLLTDWFGFLGNGFPFFLCFMLFCLKSFDLVLWVGYVEKYKRDLFVSSSHINQDLSQNPCPEVGRGRTSSKDGSLPTFTTSSTTLYPGLD